MLTNVASDATTYTIRQRHENASEDRGEREQREQVALVDARRDDEERQGHDGHADEDRQPVGAARDE